jgi:hypothetical protein
MSSRDGDVLDLVLGKLEGVQGRGGSWMARCPAHEDAKASLHISRGKDHPVVLKCHAGCQTADVVAGIGLTMEDISAPHDEGQPAAEWTPFGPALAVYRYADENGTVLFEVCRTAGKQFPQRRPDPASRSGWKWSTAGIRRVPYHLPQLIAGVREGKRIYVAEGEKDVHAIEVAGGVATCNPGGAGKWRSEYSAHFRGADVLIVRDKDEPGRQHAEDVARHLGRVAKSVAIVQAAEGKDAADHLAARCSLEDFQPAAQAAVSDSPPRQVSEMKGGPDQGGRSRSDTSDGSDTDVDGELLAGVHDGAWLQHQEFPDLQYAVPGLIPEGLTLEVGPPKAGKSWLTLDLLLGVASGGMALGRIKASPPRRVLYLALEDGDRRMQDRCRALLGGEPIPPLFCYQTRIVPGQVLATIAAWMRRHPDTALVVVDTLGKVMPPALQGESAYQRDYRVGAALKALADASPGLAIVVLHHDRKANVDDFVDAVSGTHGLAGAADTIIVLCRKRQSTDGSLKVTGRDVPENEYALRVLDGKAWQLAGADLSAAAAEARRRDDAGSLGEVSSRLLNVIRQHPEGIRAGDLTSEFGRDVYQYLGRLTEAGRIDKVARGLYVPVGVSEPSEVSEPQVSTGSESDTGSYLAQRDPDAPDVKPPCEHEHCWEALAGRCLGGSMGEVA